MVPDPIGEGFLGVRLERFELVAAVRTTVLDHGIYQRQAALNYALGPPVFFEHAHGSRLVDVDGNEYIDYLLGQGPTSSGTLLPMSSTPSRKPAAGG